MVRDKLYQIILRFYIPYTQTGNISGLKKYGINEKNIDELNNILDEELGNKEDIKLEIESNKLTSKYTIQKLKILSKALSSIMFYEDQINKLSVLIDREVKENKSKYFIEEVYKITQLRIENIEDIKRLDAEIDRRVEKYIERFKDNDEEKKDGVSFTQIAFSVFRLNGFDKIDYETSLGSFIELKNMIPKQQGDGRRPQ